MPYFQTHLTLTIQERSKRKNSCCVVFFCVRTSAHVASTLGMAQEIYGFVPRLEGFHGEYIQGHGQMRGPLLPAGCLVLSGCYRASHWHLDFSPCANSFRSMSTMIVHLTLSDNFFCAFSMKLSSKGEQKIKQKSIDP